MDEAEAAKREASAQARAHEALAASDERRVKAATAEFLAEISKRGWAPNQIGSSHAGWVLRSYQSGNQDYGGHQGIALTPEGTWLVCKRGSPSAWERTDHPARDCVADYPGLGEQVRRDQGPPYCDPAAQVTRFFARFLVG